MTRTLRRHLHSKRAAELVIKLLGYSLDRDEKRIAHSRAVLQYLVQGRENALNIVGCRL